MRRNIKWSVLAVAVAAATASVAQADTFETIIVWDEDVTIDDTRNYETNVTNYTEDVTYTDNFEWNTTINEESNTTTNYNEDVTYTDNFEWNTTINEEYNTRVDQTLVTHDEQVNVDSNIERDEHNVSVSLRKDLSLTSDINFSGDPTLSGDIAIDSAAIAVVDNRQSVSANLVSNDQVTNNASISEDVASGAEGNMAFNVSSGDNNVQDNAAALSAADASFAFGMADAEVFVNQQGFNNATSNLGVANNASISGAAFSGASGNIGANITAGNNNAQKNALSASVATSAYAQASVSSNQISTGNSVTNAPQVQESLEQVQVALSGAVTGTTSSSGSGSYGGAGAAYQMDNFYLDTWESPLPHPNTAAQNHLDMDNEIQNAVANPNRPGVGGIAFDTEEDGSLAFTEVGDADLQASLTGTLTYTNTTIVAAATNNASLSGSAFSGASGNIGVNVSAGTGNLQANSLAMAVAQPSAGGGETPPPSGGE
jgi:hypothetical protein